MNGFNNLLYISKERTGGLKQVRLRKKKITENIEHWMTDKIWDTVKNSIKMCNWCPIGEERGNGAEEIFKKHSKQDKYKENNI